MNSKGFKKPEAHIQNQISEDSSGGDAGNYKIKSVPLEAEYQRQMNQKKSQHKNSERFFVRKTAGFKFFQNSVTNDLLKDDVA